MKTIILKAVYMCFVLAYLGQLNANAASLRDLSAIGRASDSSGINNLEDSVAFTLTADGSITFTVVDYEAFGDIHINRGSLISSVGRVYSVTSPGFGVTITVPLSAGLYRIFAVARYTGSGAPFDEAIKVNVRNITFTDGASPVIDAFTVNNPAPPSASLSPLSQNVNLGSPASLNILASNGASSQIAGPSFTATNPPSAVTFVPSPVGTQTYTLSVQPILVSTITWIVQNATTLLLNTPSGPIDATSLGGIYSAVEAGSYTLTASNASGTITSTSVVAVFSTVATATATVVVSASALLPAINSFVINDAPSPILNLTLAPPLGVNPQPISVTWSATNTTAVTVVGPSLSATTSTGSEGVLLPGGTHSYTITARPGLPTLSWAASNVDRVILNTPSGAVDVTSLPRSFVANDTGEYSLVASNGVGSVSSPPLTVSPPLPVSLTRTAIVDVTLIVGSTAGGSVSGAGVKSFSSTAAPVALPDIGFTFVGWSGDYVSASNPASIVMDGDKAVLANFAVNNFVVNTSANPVGAGTVTGGGIFPFGSSTSLLAVPNSTHVFVSWSGAVTGAVNPSTFVVRSAANVVANFAAIRYTLVTSTTGTGGGTVTPGGIYDINSPITVAASPDALSRFVGWTGDAGGTVNPVIIIMNGNKNLVAVFQPKLPQTITFPNLGTFETGATVTLGATASSGLPITYIIISGPATFVASNQVRLTGSGAITVRATQPGDATFLPAPAVDRSFTSLPPPTVTFREDGADTKLQNSKNHSPNHSVKGP